MNNPNQDAIKAITTKMLLQRLAFMPGAIMVGLSLHTLFLAKGKPVFSILNNSILVYSMLIIGLVIMAIDQKQQITLAKEREKIKNGSNT